MPANYQKLRPEQCTSAVLLQKKSNAAVLPFKSLKEVLKLCCNARDKHIDHLDMFQSIMRNRGEFKAIYLDSF